MNPQADTDDRPTVLTAADPVSVLEHQLEKRGSFNPLEAPSSASHVYHEPTAAGIGLNSTKQNRGAGGERGNGKSDTLIVVRSSTLSWPFTSNVRQNAS